MYFNVINDVNFHEIKVTILEDIQERFYDNLIC